MRCERSAAQNESTRAERMRSRSPPSAVLERKPQVEVGADAGHLGRSGAFERAGRGVERGAHGAPRGERIGRRDRYPGKRTLDRCAGSASAREATAQLAAAGPAAASGAAGAGPNSHVPAPRSAAPTTSPRRRRSAALGA